MREYQALVEGSIKSIAGKDKKLRETSMSVARTCTARRLDMICLKGSLRSEAVWKYIAYCAASYYPWATNMEYGS